ncbi:hypothetical protein ES705_32784 [subsurface metagenome]
MPDWTAPFHMPHTTTEDFKRKKAEYVAKHGYRYSIPGFDDIFHLGIEKSITPEEDNLWKTGRKDDIPPDRRDEIYYIKKNRKRRYLDMLGSPLPEIVNNRAALLTSIDDAQDALTTLAVTGFVAARALPGAYRLAVLAGTGWIMIAAQCLNLATFVLAPEQIALSRKRIQDNLTKDNPFTKKARLKTALRLRNAKIGIGAACEIAQTTDQVFGVGISLGAVMALPFNIVAGSARLITGDPVRVTYPVPYMPHWVGRAKKLHNAQLAILGLPEGTDDFEMTTQIIAANALSQMELTHAETMHPLDYVKDVLKIELRAPTPEKGYLLEILEETDPDWRETVTWPSTGKTWSRVNSLIGLTHENVTNNFRKYAYRQKHSELGFIASQNACFAGMNTLQALEGEGSVEYDYTAWSKSLHALLDQGYVPPDNLTEMNKTLFTDWLEAHERADSCPSIPEALAYAKYNCGWEFVRI